jgi:hypothetical protein
MKAAAIMQPTYLPWAGYFGMMDRVDVFILLDTVQFAKRSWQQRNQIKTAQGPLMLTVPVLSKGAREQRINQVVIDRSRDFPASHVKAIELAYRRAPYFGRYAPALFALLRRPEEQLCHLTILLIEWLKAELGITTELQRTSDLGTTGSRAELLADVCAAIGATHYLSPPGSREYMEASDAFAERGIVVAYHEFAHPEYPQLGKGFVPYMSVIDLLFNAGPDSLGIIRSAYAERRLCGASP